MKINDLDIASANLGWMVAQALLAVLVSKKLIDPSDAQKILGFCHEFYRQSDNPDRAAIRAKVLEMLKPLIAQYGEAPSDQRH